MLHVSLVAIRPILPTQHFKQSLLKERNFTTCLPDVNCASISHGLAVAWWVCYQSVSQQMLDIELYYYYQYMILGIGYAIYSGALIIELWPQSKQMCFVVWIADAKHRICVSKVQYHGRKSRCQFKNYYAPSILILHKWTVIFLRPGILWKRWIMMRSSELRHGVKTGLT